MSVSVWNRPRPGCPGVSSEPISARPRQPAPRCPPEGDRGPALTSHIPDLPFPILAHGYPSRLGGWPKPAPAATSVAVAAARAPWRSWRAEPTPPGRRKWPRVPPGGGFSLYARPPEGHSPSTVPGHAGPPPANPAVPASAAPGQPAGHGARRQRRRRRTPSPHAATAHRNRPVTTISLYARSPEGHRRSSPSPQRRQVNLPGPAIRQPAPAGGGVSPPHPPGAHLRTLARRTRSYNEYAMRSRA